MKFLLIISLLFLYSVSAAHSFFPKNSSEFPLKKFEVSIKGKDDNIYKPPMSEFFSGHSVKLTALKSRLPEMVSPDNSIFFRFYPKDDTDYVAAKLSVALYADLCGDETLFFYFSQSIGTEDPDITPIPIGFEIWEPGCVYVTFTGTTFDGDRVFVEPFEITIVD